MSLQVWQKGAKAQPYCQHFQARDRRKSKLEASVETTFLLKTMPRGTPRSIHWYEGVRGAKHVEELEVSASTEGAACEAGPTEIPKTLRPWGPASSETLWWGEELRVWMKPRAVPRNEISWLGDSALLANFTLSPRHSKCLRITDLWYISSSSDWARMSQSSRKFKLRIPSPNLWIILNIWIANIYFSQIIIIIILYWENCSVLPRSIK